MSTLTIYCQLDALDSEQATYKSLNGAVAIVDRASFDAQGRPLEIQISLPGRTE